MEKILVLIAGSNKCCLDMTFVESVHTDSEDIQAKLSELNLRDSLVSEISNESVSLELQTLISRGQKTGTEKQQLVVLAENDLRFGLFTDNSILVPEISEAAVQHMPLAFTSECRECFPEVVVLGKDAIPLMTPSSIMKLAENKFDGMQEG